MTKFIYKGQSPRAHNDLYHYGRSKEDGAPGVGTGNWRRSGLPPLSSGEEIRARIWMAEDAVSGWFSKFKKKKDTPVTQEPPKNKKAQPAKSTIEMYNDPFEAHDLDLNKPADRKHYREVADLGLKAERSIDLKWTHGSDIKLDDGNRKMFMNQREKPNIAHYIVSGYSADQIMDFLGYVYEKDIKYEDNPHMWDLKEYLTEGHDLEEFARACEEERDKEK